MRLDPGFWESSREEMATLLRYSYRDNPMDRGAAKVTTKDITHMTELSSTRHHVNSTLEKGRGLYCIHIFQFYWIDVTLSQSVNQLSS